jgi:ParB family chromosome partitioning protein|tara:strand:- start:64 stop:1158 length:1095 start_codon:yes stop_codon:yes gene_type:complete
MNATPTLEMLDPVTLTVAINVRKDAALTADFVASIKEHGVMEPVIAHRNEDGVVHVLMGQRRTRAAVEAERPLIPVLIIDSPEEAERIVTQVVENIQRAELTEADEADAYHQLSQIGVSAAAIAKKTGRTKTKVEKALKAKASTTGSKALESGYTLDMALVMTEFEGDQDAIEELESVIRDEPQYFDHIAQKLRDDRESKTQLSALIEELIAQGKAIVEDAGHYADEENLYVSAAKRADMEPATDEDANAYIISTDYQGQHTAQPVISDWKELGFTPKYERYNGGSAQAQKGPMTEEQKAERKTLIANNKAMQSVLLTSRQRVKHSVATPGWPHLIFTTNGNGRAAGHQGDAETVMATVGTVAS